MESPHIEGRAIAAIRKDGGDDVDATHGMLADFCPRCARDSGEITLTGGEGIWYGNAWGLDCRFGYTPSNTYAAARPVCGARSDRPGRCGDFAPEGEVRAQKAV